MCLCQRLEYLPLRFQVLLPSGSVGGDVIHKRFDFGSKSSVGDDLIYEAHEDLGRIPIPEGSPGILIQPKGADEGCLELGV